MRYIIIDDNEKFANALCKELNGNQNCPDDNIIIAKEQEATSELSETVKAQINGNNDTVIIINVNLETKDSKRQEQKGIELLIWLRIKGVMNHVVLYSFETLHELLKRNPKHLIATSKGTSFVQLPSDFKKLDLEKLGEIKAEENNLKQTLKAIFDIAQFRHSFANVWGLERLVEVDNELNTKAPKFLLKETKQQQLIDYQIAKYLFVEKSIGYNSSSEESELKSKIDEAIDAITKENSKLQESQRNKILLIDDKANEGWLCFFKHLLPNAHFEILPIKENINDLIEEFKQKYKDDEFLMVILDLRLLSSEENEHDYSKLLSVQLFKKMLDEREDVDNYWKFKYFNLKFLLFTASNQLKNMLDVMYRNDHTPYRIFIKEGFDINQMVFQKYKSYLNFIRCLKDTITAPDRLKQKPKRLESCRDAERKKIEKFQNQLSNGTSQRQLNRLCDKLKEYTHIILDSNIFVDAPFIPLSPDLNTIMIYPVYKELERWTQTREETHRKFCANYILPLYENNIDKASLSGKIEEIDEKFNSNNIAEAADGYFLEAIQYYQKYQNANVLFITNDKRAKKDNENEKSPMQQVQEWVDSCNANNVNVMSCDKSGNLIDAKQLLNNNVQKSPISDTGLTERETNSLTKGTVCSGKVVSFLPDKLNPNNKYAALIELYPATTGILNRNKAKSLNNGQTITNLETIIKVGDFVNVMVTKFDSFGIVLKAL